MANTSYNINFAVSESESELQQSLMLTNECVNQQKQKTTFFKSIHSWKVFEKFMAQSYYR